jgi:hypothetical protein
LRIRKKWPKLAFAAGRRPRNWFTGAKLIKGTEKGIDRRNNKNPAMAGFLLKFSAFRQNDRRSITYILGSF